MDKDKRRNSILKPAMNPTNQPSAFEYEEEQTETFTSSRRKPFKKRVSFAGRDEIKEFQMHEILTIQKLEIALHQLQNDTQFSNMGNTASWDSEKENINQQTPLLREISIETDDMEITSISSIECNRSKSIPQEIELREIISEYDCMEITSLVGGNNDESTVQEVEMEVCAYSLGDIPDETDEEGATTKELTLSHKQRKIVEDDFCGGKNSIEISIQQVDMAVVYENKNLCHTSKNGKASLAMEVCPKIKKGKMECTKTNCLSGAFKPVISETGITSPELIQSGTCISTRVNVTQELVQEMKSFCSDESNEHFVLAKQFNWEISFVENILVFSKIHNYLTLKLKLDTEYTYQNVKHYVVEDIEIDTRKDAESKWTKFGLMILENSLENSNLREVCGNTQDLPKFMYMVEEHTRMFVDFATGDLLKFQLLTNPRSIRFDGDYSNFNLTFESSNLENLSCVRISLNLIPRFPLSAKDISVESILGMVNKAEITNMISNIRPSTLYLTRIAECVEDFLKFQSLEIERKTLNCAKLKCIN